MPTGGETGDSSHTSAGPTVAHSLEIDPCCLGCGYNLRGLSGDPVRCPECAYENPVGDIELPAEVVRRQLQRMETAPLLCIIALIIGIPGVVGMGALVVQRMPPDLLPCVGAYVCGCAIGWGFACARFRHYFLGTPGGLRGLLRYHAAAAGFGLAVPGPIVGMDWALDRWLPRRT